MDETKARRDDSGLRAAALRGVRRHRGLSRQEVARRMNLPLRTYERFEAGDARLNLDYLHRFGEATGADPNGVLAAIVIGSPAFAVRSADNKLATILTILLQGFDRDLGDRIATLDARVLIAAFERAFESLAEEANRGASDAEAFLAQGREGLSSARPKPGR